MSRELLVQVQGGSSLSCHGRTSAHVRRRRLEVVEVGPPAQDGRRLSFSRFLHLFKQEIGVPFRSFRTWKRARSLLHYINRDSNLAHAALDTGYPDSTHFSHSIRQVYGLKPKDIFAGSRRLEIHGSTSNWASFLALQMDVQNEFLENREGFPPHR